jgi:hypothetical protein
MAARLGAGAWNCQVDVHYLFDAAADPVLCSLLLVFADVGVWVAAAIPGLPDQCLSSPDPAHAHA